MAEEEKADQKIIDRLEKEAEEHEDQTKKERKRLIQVAADEGTLYPEGIYMPEAYDAVQDAKSKDQKESEKKEAAAEDETVAPEQPSRMKSGVAPQKKSREPSQKPNA